MQSRNQPQHQKNEEAAGQVHAQQQLAQWQQGLQAILPNGESHGAERPERCRLHDQRDDFESQVRQGVGCLHQGLPQVVRGQGHAEEDSDQQDLQNFPVGECAHQGIGNDVQHKIHGV